MEGHIEVLDKKAKSGTIKGVIKGNVIELEKDLIEFGFKPEKKIVVRIVKSKNPYKALYGILKKPITEKEIEEAKKSLMKNV